MKVIVAGSRDYNNYNDICYTLGDLFPYVSSPCLAGRTAREEIEVVSGTARGVDTMGESWAGEVGIPIKQFPAQWDKYGKSAGYKRNLEMAEYSDMLVAFWDGESKGTKHMIDLALKHKLEVHVYIV